MSAVSDYVAKQKEYNTRVAAAIDGIVTDIQALADKITELQNTPPVLTPEDDALLNEADAMAQAMVTRIEALDAQNPPTPPVVNP